jgi:ABC-2 type transport system permease protein
MAQFVAAGAAALRSIRRATLWWSVALAAIVAVTVALWPAFRGASGISQAIDALPPAVIDAFGLQDFGSPAGFLRGNLYELLVPMLFAIAAVAMVSGQTASDEAAGRLELFLSQPIDRRKLFAARLLACLIGLTVIVLVTIAVQLVFDGLVDLSIDPGYVVGTILLCGLLASLYAAFAYLVACLRPSPGLVLGASLGLMIVGYLVNALFPISDALKPLRVISPWDWAFAGNPLEHSVELWRVVVLVVIGVILAIIGSIVVRSRDIASG